MSYVADVRIIPRSQLKELKKVQDEAIRSQSQDAFFEFLDTTGELIGDEKYSGQVYMDLITFLREKKGIDLEKGVMSDFTSAFMETFEEYPWNYLFLTHADYSQLKSSLDPSLFKVEEMQSYIDQIYRMHKDMYEGYGSYMLETLENIFSVIRNLKEDQVINIIVY